jgi:hypothetical protein
LIGKFTFLAIFVISFSLTPVFASNPTDSLHFDNSDNGNFILKGNIQFSNQENPSYQLDGNNDYLILDSNLPEKLSSFSISVWTKPEYEIGSSKDLSIVSQSHSFDLSINNDKIEKNVAVFSIFDGIKWHTVQSKSSIPQQWNHIVATYSDEKVKIFVNGAQEGSMSINGDYSLTHQYGVSNQNSYDFIDSNSKVIVGAFNPSIREGSTTKNYFSGEIDDVNLYDTNLSQNQIFNLYQNGRISYNPIIKNIEEPILPVTGVANSYGFISDPNHSIEQKFLTISTEGYKVKKSSSSSNLSFTNQFRNTDNQITNTDKQPNPTHLEIIENKIEEDNGYHGDLIKICKPTDNGQGITLTFNGITLSLLQYLNNGASIGECSE